MTGQVSNIMATTLKPRF